MLESVKHCHDQGIIHRDLKPGENLYFSQFYNNLVNFLNFLFYDGIMKLQGYQRLVFTKNTQFPISDFGGP